MIDKIAEISRRFIKEDNAKKLTDLIAEFKAQVLIDELGRIDGAYSIEDSSRALGEIYKALEHMDQKEIYRDKVDDLWRCFNEKIIVLYDSLLNEAPLPLETIPVQYKKKI